MRCPTVRHVPLCLYTLWPWLDCILHRHSLTFAACVACAALVFVLATEEGQ
jgi:hypothetical protein